MKRFRVAVLCLGIAAALALAGCGGGGGGGGSTTPDGGGTQPPPASGRVLTGTVVSSGNGAGVDGVVVRVSPFYSATTANGGKFSINLGTDTAGLDDYYFFQVDTSGAGASYPVSELVEHNGQTHYPDKVDMPVAVLNGESDVIGTITVRKVDDDMPPPPSYPHKNTLIYGRVLSEKTGAGIQGVTVTFGQTSAYTATSGKRGYFALNLGIDGAVLPLFPSANWPPTFGINTSTAGTAYPATLQVSYRSQTSAQDSIAVPQEILLASESAALGAITVLDGGNTGGGGDGPPPPPTF